MDELLKGNFKVKKEIKEDKKAEKEKTLEEKLKENAMSSIGGSMVYVNRRDLTWDPEEKEKEAGKKEK